MYDIRKLIDPLLLGMKVRDSMQSGNPIHVQNYVLDVLKNSVNQTGDGAGSSVAAPTVPDGLSQTENDLNRSFSQIQGIPGFGDSSHLHNYIRSVMDQALNQPFNQPANTPVQTAGKVNTKNNNVSRSSNNSAQIFETHDFIYIRIPVPGDINERLIDTQVGPGRIVVKWAPGGMEQVIQLPVDVKNNGAIGIVKNRILEIKLEKEQNPDFRKIDIQRG